LVKTEEALKLDPYLTPHTKTNSKWIKDVHLIAETIKLPEDKEIGENLDDTGYGEAFFRYNSKDNNPWKK